MAEKADEQDTRIPHLRAIAMPRDTNSSGEMFGGWTLSQMDLAGATFAARHSGGRVATVSIDAMKFLRPIEVGDDVSCYCQLEKKASIRLQSRSRHGRPVVRKLRLRR
jgi:acyl-CoA thioesterase YciA